jgi:hypothetical protein
LTIQGNVIGKAILGADVGVNINLNTKALREGRFGDFDFSVNIDARFSVGPQLEGAITGSAAGSDGSVLDQTGVHTISLKPIQIPVNLAAAIPPDGGLVVGASGTFAPSAENGNVSSFGYMIGGGLGAELSVNVLDLNDTAFYLGPNQKIAQIPFANPRFGGLLDQAIGKFQAFISPWLQ